MILFSILMLIVFVNLITLAIKLSWGILKIIFHIILFPAALILMVVGGLLHVATPIIIGVLILLLIFDGKKYKEKH